MTKVHFVLQKKGGVGKSLISTMWFQFLQERGYNVFGIDTDPSNHSFAGFAELGVTELDILNAEKDIDPRRFDVLIETVFELPGEDPNLIVDSGSSCFPSLKSYLLENKAFDVLLEAGHQVILHVPITGGSDMVHTAECLDELLVDFPDLVFVVWKNRYNGDIVMNGKEFEDFKLYKKHSSRLEAVIDLPHKKQATYGKDIELLLAKKHTFKAGINSSMPVMTRQRLKTFWEESCIAMEKALVVL